MAEHAAEIRRPGGRAVADIIEIGRRLHECKKWWLPWLEREFGWSEWTAHNFISLHRLARSKSGKVLDRRIPASALHLLARSSTPEEARARTGERVTLRVVEQIVGDSRSGETGAGLGQAVKLLEDLGAMPDIERRRRGDGAGGGEADGAASASKQDQPS